MAQVQINQYIENNTTDVYSTTAKAVGNEVKVGDSFGGGVVTPDIQKVNSAGVFIGIDGRKQ